MAEHQPTAVRYSTTNVTNSKESQSFGWEQPVPVNPFWDTIPYCTATNFLSHYTPSELSALPIDTASTAPNPEKYTLLLSLLCAKLSALPPALHETNPSLWRSLKQSIFTYQDALGLPEAETTIREMVEQRSDKQTITMSNVVTLHMLADYLVKTGQCEEAERVEREVCAFMDGHERLGRDSPQAINARRIIARAIWGQGEGRREDARGLIGEIEGIVEGMGEGRFAVYREEERELNEAMKAGLGA
ncbi:hypothetical protein B0T16DRAFT_450916 [Cercophora newfieldiana]|uniref:Uncharacterized protein n=1 Tax=Cercophora newfieldiana TaxID=92897 RepID=A0AA39YMB1_9PEZI|nr:hypothetical protein B0T16DRAFT_450916 [Cercophora newfieldiana]